MRQTSGNIYTEWRPDKIRKSVMSHSTQETCVSGAHFKGGQVLAIQVEAMPIQESGGGNTSEFVLLVGLCMVWTSLFVGLCWS